MDIYEENRAEVAVRECEAVTRNTLDNAFDAIISMDAQGKIANWNRGAETILGWPASAIVGKQRVETIIPPQYNDRQRRGGPGYQKFYWQGHQVFLAWQAN